MMSNEKAQAAVDNNNRTRIAQVTKEDGNQVKSVENVKQLIEDELEKKGNGGLWAWTLFILCLTPNIFNGFHVNSYVFLSTPPANYYCVLPELDAAGWTHDEIRNISTRAGTAINNTCTVYNYNYTKLSSMNYRDAILYVKNYQSPIEINCLSEANSVIHYEQAPGLSIVPEWDLVCERTALRSTVQVALSLGKFLGASSFGFVSDKYGRRTAFCIACLTYITGSLMVTISPGYLVLLLGRLCLGLASSGIFYPAFTLLTENIGSKCRSWMSISFNFSYPIGMILLALSAYLVRPWRMLSLTLTVPAFFLLLHIYFIVESPRWLLSKGRESRAYRMVFGTRMPDNLKQLVAEQRAKEPIVQKVAEQEDESLSVKFQRTFSILHSIYGPVKLRKQALICHFTWCVTSLCYYVTALNADNISSNRFVYVAATGSVDIMGYLSLIFLLKYVGRTRSCSGLFFISATALLVILIIPRDIGYLMVFFSMLGRFGITSVYAVMTLHTAEMFPTEIRNSVLGISSTCAHVGGIMAPYVVDLLGQIHRFIPTTICGVTILICAVLILLQPETKDKLLTDHVDDSEDIELQKN